MKVIKYLPIFAFCLMTTGCNSNQNGPKKSGIDLTNLDTTAVPGTNFYQYACGGWMKQHPLTDEYSRLGSFDMLAENNKERLNDLIEELATKKDNVKGTAAQKIADLYNLAMNADKLNKDGIAPIKPELDAIDALTQNQQIYGLLPDLYRKGLSPYFILYVSADDMNSDMNILHTYQTGLGMGERDYYLLDDEKTTDIRDNYKKFITKAFELAGYTASQSEEAMKAVMDIETRIAKASRSQVELRNPHANYNIKTVADLKKEYSTFDWDAYFAGLGLTDVKQLNVGQPEQLKEVSDIIAKTPLQAQKYYLQWNLINESASYLSDNLVKANFDFYGRVMSGTKEMRPRWKRAVSTVNSALGQLVGQMYVEKYFPAEAKERMVQLVKNLQTSLGERIKAQEWMDDATKQKALDKLATFRIKIGYPDKWKDYSNLNIENDSYWANIIRANVWSYNEMLAKAGKAVDKEEWHMTPQTVNAYYSPSSNEICFPAGILQYPFFDMNADNAFNYGAIGVVIGHEMTHGFDDQGRQYNKEGNLKNWWTKEDATKFDERTQVMVDFFNLIEVAPGVHANGELTLGENIADHGGLQVSYNAFEKTLKTEPLKDIDGFTPQQRFFLAYANVWANNIRDKEVLRRTKLDVHSLGKWRVNGALPHIDAWYDAFNITENDPMFIPKAERVTIW